MQAPLKERYTSEPAAALVTLSATGTLGEHVSYSAEDAVVAAGAVMPSWGWDGLQA